jgi:exonuclease VII large subunit
MPWNDPSDNRKPKIVDELYDVGLIISEAGPGTRTYMRVNTPGVYFDGQQRPVSERDAQRAGFNVEYYRAQRRAAEIKQQAAARADQILQTDGAQALKSPEQKREERAAALRDKVAKAIKDMEKRSQAAADKMITRDLDTEQAIPHS